MKNLALTDQRDIGTIIVAGVIDDVTLKTGMPAIAMTNEQSVVIGTITTDGVSAAGRGPRIDQPGPRDVEEAVDGQDHPRARVPGTKTQAQNITAR